MNAERWYCSTERMTFLVAVEDGVIVDGAPIVRKFIGQPAKNLGDWLRQQGAPTFRRISDDNPYVLTHEYRWGNNEKRTTLKGRFCRILLRGAMRSVMVEFENGQREIVSHRALRERRTDASPETTD